MAELLVGMAGSLIVLAGFAGGYWFGKKAAKNEQKEIFAEDKKKETSKPTTEEQFRNLMEYGGNL